MTELDTRLDTEKARRQIINRHLYNDHDGYRFSDPEYVGKRGATEARYRAHAALHINGEWDHDHDDFDDLSEEYGHYYEPTPLRIRKERVPKHWTITYHLASDHEERVVGSDLLKLMKHEEMHSSPEGWGGVRLHRHTDENDLEQIEYKEQ